MQEPEVLPKVSAGARLMKLLPQGKQAMLLIARLVPMLREVAPLLEGLLGGALGGAHAAASTQDIENRLRDHLKQSATVMDAQAEEVRFRLKEQTAATARLEADVRAIRDQISHEGSERARLQGRLDHVERLLKQSVAGIAVCALLLLVVIFELLRHRG